MIGADSIDKYLDSLEDGLPEYEGMLIRSFAMTEMIAIRGAQNNSAPYDLNLDLLEIFSWKITLKKVPKLILIGGQRAPLGPFLFWAYEFT